MTVSIDRPCLFDPTNRLTIRQADDGDMALQAFHMGHAESNFKMHRDNPTLRTLQGGGRYVDYFKDNAWKRDTSLYRMTTALFCDTHAELTKPTFLKPAEPPILSAETPVILLQFPSDDGGNELGFRLIRHADYIAASTFQTRQDPAKSVIVWLGHARLDPFFETFWDAGVDTVAYNKQYNNHRQLRHDTVPYGSMTALPVHTIQ